MKNVGEKSIDERATSEPDIFTDRLTAATHITHSFACQSEAERRQAFDFAREILGTFGHDRRAQMPYLDAILMTSALVEVSGGDVRSAQDAFRTLTGRAANPDEDAQRRSFALQCELALDPTGFEALLYAAPHTMPALEGLTKTEQLIHRYAHTETLRAAHRLLEAWPKEYPAPRNLDELLGMANRILPDEELAAFPWFQPAVDEPLKQALLSQPLALRALVAGAQLMQDPRATPSAPLRAAYFAFRNSISEEDLPKIQSRAFRIVTYAQRYVSNAKTESWLKRVSSNLRHTIRETDTPFAGFDMGTAGVLLDHPDKDFAQAHAIDVVIDALNKIIVNEPPRKRGEAPDPAVAQATVDAAVARRWKEKITAKGWRDDMRFGRYERHRIVRDVATALNLDYGYVLRNRRHLLVPRVVNAFDLEAMAIRARADMNQVIARTHRSHATVGRAPQTLGESLTRMIQMRSDGHRPPENAEENFVRMREVIEHIPPTWDLRGSRERYSGVLSPTSANLGENFGPKFGIHHLPVLAALLPDFTRVRGRRIFFEIGSSAHEGHIKLGTGERSQTSAGMGAYLGVYKGALVSSVNGGVSVGGERIHEEGVAFRARLEHPDDPINNTAWRGTLQQLLTTMSQCGPDGALPETAEQMWAAIVDEFFKDPSLSVDLVTSGTSTRYAAANASVGLRLADARGNKLGVFGTVIANRFRTSRYVEDATGDQRVSTHARSKGRAVTAAAAAVYSPEAFNITGLGPFTSTSLPSLPLAARSKTLFGASTNSVLRLFSDHGVIDAEKTFLDTEFGSPKGFLDYIDNNNDEWRDALGSQENLDEFTTKVQLSTMQGNRRWGERRHLTDEAAERINKYRDMLGRSERSTRKSNPYNKRVVAHIQRKLAAELENPANFQLKLLYAYEVNTVAKTRGFNFVGAAATTTATTAEREIIFVHALNDHPKKTHS